jgi:hypothetical protein
MILCISFIGAVVVLEAWPVYAIFVSRFRGTPLPIATLLGIAVSFALVAALHVIVLAESIRRGLRRLEAIEP